MREYKGKKVYKEEANDMLLEGCNASNLEKVYKAVELYGADVNASDQAGYARALMYACKRITKNDDSAEAIIQFLISKGAEVDFKHGDKANRVDSKPYFVYWMALNPNASDDIVEYVVRHSSKNAITYKPTTKPGGYYAESALDVIKKNRPKLYKKLFERKSTPVKR